MSETRFWDLSFSEQKSLVVENYELSRSGKCRWKCCQSQSHTHTGEKAFICSIIKNNGRKIHPDNYLDINFTSRQNNDSVDDLVIELISVLSKWVVNHGKSDSVDKISQILKPLLEMKK